MLALVAQVSALQGFSRLLAARVKQRKRGILCFNLEAQNSSQQIWEFSLLITQ